MKTIVHDENARDTLLHIEAAGCIINIRVNLTDDTGHKTTRVDIQCDQYAGEQGWFITDENGEKIKHLGILIKEETEQEYENRRTYERMLEQPIAKMRICDVLDKMNSDTFALLHYRINEGTHKGDYIVEVKRIPNYKQEPSNFQAYSLPTMFGINFNTPQTVGDVIKAYHEKMQYWHGKLLAYHWVAQDFEKRYMNE